MRCEVSFAPDSNFARFLCGDALDVGTANVADEYVHASLIARRYRAQGYATRRPQRLRCRLPWGPNYHACSE